MEYSPPIAEDVHKCAIEVLQYMTVSRDNTGQQNLTWIPGTLAATATGCEGVEEGGVLVVVGGSVFGWARDSSTVLTTYQRVKSTNSLKKKQLYPESQICCKLSPENEYCGIVDTLGAW